VFCHEGYALSLAVGTLSDRGVPNVHDLAGGLTAWAGAGLPVEREELP
jgi:rhodanese-related sulfurtransferase